MTGLVAKCAPTTRARLAKLGIVADEQLVLHLPLRYEDETRIMPLAAFTPDEPAQAEVRVRSTDVRYKPRRTLEVMVEDESADACLRFLNFYPRQIQILAPGTLLRIYGAGRRHGSGLLFIHPRLQRVLADDPLPTSLTPVYPTTAGLSQLTIKKLIDQALEQCLTPENIPAEMIADLALPSLSQALTALHRPRALDPPIDGAHPAWRRIKLDEALAQQLALRAAYCERRSSGAPALRGPGALVARLLDALPYTMTAAQARCWREINADLMSAQPMQRLLQGDVGCGKTLLALLATVHVAENGLQSAILAPTEALAEQHYTRFCDVLSALGVPVVWLAGGLSAKQRRDALALLATDAAVVAVGTHALLEDSVVFANLGLAIVDEQHRFGVTQRAGLGGKGQHPHLLMLSATPIPRTLAMCQFGDLDVSVIDQLPPGRTPIVTHLVAQRRRNEVIDRLAAACRGGAQAYWVCPLIEQSEAADLRAAQATWSELSEALPDLKIGLIHGRLEREPKRAALAAFASGNLHVLVATTVVEVGIDVANATVIVIDHAERYGLAQLHQLRGRVGRGAQPSSCILLYDAQLTDTARQRLRAMYEHHDGFALARIDLELRGPGELLGMRQSGIPELRFTDLNADQAILERARELAHRLWDEAPEIAARHLARWRGAPAP